MKSFWIVSSILLLYVWTTSAQLPPRLQIPGALIAQSRPTPFNRQQQRAVQENLPPRPRRPIPNAIPLREVRPVVEDDEQSSAFDEEVSNFAISALNSARAEAASSEENENRPLPFRPERPVPVSRDQIREKPQQQVRQEIQRPPPRPVIRQELREPVRQQTRASLPPPPPRKQRPVSDDEEFDDRRRKKPVEILRKYRTDNEDGSITWGFENDDGTFKEETLGIDCIIRGQYGYVDPDGVKREFTYEAGNKCDEPEEDEELLLEKPNLPPISSRNKPQPQFRPQQAVQYAAN